jgi:hypothetical protein
MMLLFSRHSLGDRQYRVVQVRIGRIRWAWVKEKPLNGASRRRLSSVLAVLRG